MKTINNVEIESQKVEKHDPEQYDMSLFFDKVKLSEEQVDRLREEFFDEFDIIKKERGDANLEKTWKELDNQYEGNMVEDTDRQFNLHKHVTKVKVDSVVRSIMQALFETDPKFSISPLPEFGRSFGWEVCEAQSEYLDYAIDTRIDLRTAKELVTHSATLKGTGIQKNTYDIQQVKRTRVERHKGNPEGAGIDPRTGQPMVKNDGLEGFVRAHQEEIEENPKKYVGLIKKLSEGKEIQLLVEYDETTYDDPLPKFVDLVDFYTRLNTEGYKGLCESKANYERLHYTWWELKKEGKKNVLENIDELMYEHDEQTVTADGKKKHKKNKSSNKKEDYSSKEWNILEAEIFFSETEDGEEERYIAWFEEEDKVFLGMIHYPWIGIGSQFNPHYIKKKKPGFYQDGVGIDLKDNNIAEDAILNFFLEGLWSANTITPITREGSRIEEQFLNKQWGHGDPISFDENDNVQNIRFVNEFMKPMDTRGMMMAMEMLSRQDDDVSGVSGLVTGGESQLDPTAPASKTIALMEQSGMNVKPYIERIVVAWNRDAEMFLQLYGQQSEEGRQYMDRGTRSSKVTGKEPFKMIGREDLIARTNIQSKATAFDFDKMNEKRLLLSLQQVLANEMIWASKPELRWKFLRMLVKAWSPKLKNQVDQILPPLEQLKQEEQQASLQAVDQYVKLKTQEAQVTGQSPEFDIGQLMGVIQQAKAQLAMPVEEGK